MSSVHFYLNKEKRNHKTGKTPIYLRVIHNRKKSETRLNAEVSDLDSLKWDEATMRFTDRNMDLNVYLNSIDAKFWTFIHHNGTTLNQYKVRNIKNIVLGTDIKRVPLILDYLQKYYNHAIDPNAQMADGTKRNYRQDFKHMKGFLAFRKSNDASLKDMNTGMANEFRDFLWGTHPHFKRIGMKEPSALDNIKQLRTVFDRVVDEEYILNNALKK